MKVCIYGAGAIGGWVAMAFAQAGCHVSLVARGATLQALRTQGLQLTRPDHTQAHATVHAHDAPSQLGVQDVVVLAVKAPAMTDVARAVGPLIGPHTVVLTAMNGLPWWFLAGCEGPARGAPLRSIDPDGAIAAAIPAQQVLGGVVHASCALDGPGRVRQHFGNRLIVGEPDGSLSPRASALAATLQRGGIEAECTAHIQQDIWFKLWGNMTMNPISALTGATCDRILDDPLVRGLASAVMREAQDIGQRLGLPIAQEPDDRHAVTRKLGAFKTSMLQDVEAGKPLEVEALVGAVHELGRLCGVPTPHTDGLYGLVRLMARTKGLMA